MTISYSEFCENLYDAVQEFCANVEYVDKITLPRHIGWIVEKLKKDNEIFSASNSQYPKYPNYDKYTQEYILGILNKTHEKYNLHQAMKDWLAGKQTFITDAPFPLFNRDFNADCVVWTWDNAPECFKRYSKHGGGEDWVIWFPDRYGRFSSDEILQHRVVERLKFDPNDIVQIVELEGDDYVVIISN